MNIIIACLIFTVNIYAKTCKVRIPENHPFSASVLHIDLTYFKAEACSYNKICFKWGTATENNNNHYEIERSNDAIDFKNIFTLPSKAPDGSSHYNISYSGTDEDPLDGINYYRLNQVDNNNVNTYSQIISVHSISEEGLQFLVFPNCNSGNFIVQMKSLNKNGNLFILIRNPAGSIVYKEKYYVDDVFTEIKVAPEFDLEDGFYFCSFIINNKEHVMKIIVERECK